MANQIERALLITEAKAWARLLQASDELLTYSNMPRARRVLLKTVYYDADGQLERRLEMLTAEERREVLGVGLE